MENTILDRITIIPEICNGKPTIRGMRITVETILQFLSAGDSTDIILEAYHQGQVLSPPTCKLQDQA